MLKADSRTWLEFLCNCCILDNSCMPGTTQAWAFLYFCHLAIIYGHLLCSSVSNSRNATADKTKSQSSEKTRCRGRNPMYHSILSISYEAAISPAFSYRNTSQVKGSAEAGPPRNQFPELSFDLHIYTVAPEYPAYPH